MRTPCANEIGENGQPSAHSRALILVGICLFVAFFGGCASSPEMAPLIKGSPSDRFLDKITGAVWYETFRKDNGRIPTLEIRPDPGVDASALKTALKKHPGRIAIVSGPPARPDFFLRIRRSLQAELTDPHKNVVWVASAEGLATGPPASGPIILWRGLFIGPRLEAVTMSGDLTKSLSGGGGARIGYSFTNLGDVSAYMPEINIDVLSGSQDQITVTGGPSTIGLQGYVGLTDFSVDPLRFGWPFLSGKALLSVSAGVGDVLLGGGLSGSGTNLEVHGAVDLEYRLFEHFAPYIEIVGEEVKISSATASILDTPGPSPSVIIGSLNSLMFRVMLGVDWYPWTTEIATSEESP